MKEKICFYSAPFPGIKSYYEMIDTAAKFNLSAVEGFCMFEFSTPDIEEAKKIKEYADSKDIKFPCFSVYINLVGDDSEKMLERLKGYADVAKILGSPYLHHTIACELMDPLKVIPFKDELFDKGIKAAREIYDYAKNIGIKTIVEEQGYLFNGILGIRKFLDAVDRDIGLLVDFANIYQAGDNITDFVKEYSDKFLHAHIKDVFISDENKGLKTLDGKYMLEADIGGGEVNIKEVIALLKESGYDGYYALEYGADKDDSPIIEKTITYIDSLLNS